MEEAKEQIHEEEINISVVEDSQDEAQVADKAVDSDEELDRYTKGVSKRINKLNKRTREAEERAEQSVAVLNQLQAENMALRQHTANLNQNLFVAEEQSIEAKEQQANELYKKAVDSGDAELMSKADTLKSDLSIQKEKLRVAKNRQTQEGSAQQVPPSAQIQPTQQQERAPEPTKEALDWADQNPWYGDQSDANNAEASQYAYYTHFNLMNEGFEADSKDYYNELNKRIYNVYPDLDSRDKSETKDDRPTVQRVASASVGSRKKTQGNKNGVTFSQSEIKRLRGLKPYNMTEEEWLKRVAKEKQKISQRETA